VSTFVAVRFEADPAKLVAAMNADESRWQRINAAAKENGCIHHRFLAGDGEVLVTDEWESAEGFQRFFQSNQDVPQVMADMGVTAEPTISFWEALDTPDAF
jgi:Antibiotic biosynthesis monooxygenase